MPLYFHNGSPLFRNGGWAANGNCCCDDENCSSIPLKLYVTLDGGNDCAGMTGFTFELNYDSGVGVWTSGIIAFCGGTAVFTLTCLLSGLPVGAHLKDKLVFSSAITCDVTPIGGIVPCTVASLHPFYAEFSALDIGAAWAECNACCTGRETTIIFYVTE